MPLTPVRSDALAFIGLALAAAAVLSFALTPLAAWFARRTGAVDLPGAQRRVHRLVVPRGGGLAVAVSFVVVGLVAIALNNSVRAIPGVRVVTTTELLALFAGAPLAAVIGYLDDRFDLQPRWQLLGQIAVALFAVWLGMRIGFIDNPLGPDKIRFDPPFAAAVTVFWIVGMINSINFVDGLDGLSSGIGLIAALTLGVISLTFDVNQPFVTLLCAVLVGTLVGFLPWNFHPARIFIGTSGVFLLGYTLAVLAIIGTAKVAVALLVLGVPIIDTFWIIVRRALSGQSPFMADRGHFHHRLLDLGLTHRGAVLLIYGLCGLLGVLSLALSGRGGLYAFLMVVVAGGVVLYLMTRRTREALEASTYDPTEEVVRARDGARREVVEGSE